MRGNGCLGKHWEQPQKAWAVHFHTDHGKTRLLNPLQLLSSPLSVRCFHHRLSVNQDTPTFSAHSALSSYCCSKIRLRIFKPFCVKATRLKPYRRHSCSLGLFEHLLRDRRRSDN